MASTENAVMDEQLSSFIKNELMKRGIFAELLECYVDLKKAGVFVLTKSFNTTPVLFEKVWVESADSNIMYGNGCYDISVTLNFYYKKFGTPGIWCHPMMTVVTKFFPISGSSSLISVY